MTQEKVVKSTSQLKCWMRSCFVLFPMTHSWLYLCYLHHEISRDQHMTHTKPVVTKDQNFGSQFSGRFFLSPTFTNKSCNKSDGANGLSAEMRALKEKHNPGTLECLLVLYVVLELKSTASSFGDNIRTRRCVTLSHRVQTRRPWWLRPPGGLHEGGESLCATKLKHVPTGAGFGVEAVDKEHVRGGTTVRAHVYSWRYLDNQRHFKRDAIGADNLPALNLWACECRLPYRSRARSPRLPLSPPSPLDPSLCFFTPPHPPARRFPSLPFHPPSLFQPKHPHSFTLTPSSHITAVVVIIYIFLSAFQVLH